MIFVHMFVCHTWHSAPGSAEDAPMVHVEGVGAGVGASQLIWQFLRQLTAAAGEHVSARKSLFLKQHVPSGWPGQSVSQPCACSNAGSLDTLEQKPASRDSKWLSSTSMTARAELAGTGSCPVREQWRAKRTSSLSSFVIISYYIR